MIIYKITNRINGKVYIGQTTQSLKRRWNQHCNSRDCVVLHKAIRKYGRENFEITVIDHAHSHEELDNKEKLWIAFYGCLTPMGYNLEGGGTCSNKIITNEIRQKISKNHADFKGEKHPQYGKKLSLETRKKISKNHADVTGSKNPMWGKKWTNEQRNNCVRGRKVQCIETGEIFNTIELASEAVGCTCSTNISACCRGKCKTIKGYHWRYVE